VLTFTDNVDFNGFYFTLTAESDFELDPSFFVLECLSEPDSPKIIAASGECGWFVGVEDLGPTDTLPASRLTKGLDNSFTLDYSQFSCRVPQLLDAAAISVGGLALLLAALHARFCTKNGLFGVDLPISTLAAGQSLQQMLIVLALVLSWRPDVPLILFHFSVAFGFSTLLISESFLEERTFILGIVTFIMAISSAFAPSTAHTAFTRPESMQNVSTCAQLSIIACAAVSWSLGMLVLRVQHVSGATRRLSPVADACRSALAQIEEQALQQIHVLVASLEREGAIERSRVRTASAEDAATWRGIHSHIERVGAHLSDCLTVSHETQAVLPRHLLLTAEHILEDGSAGQRRATWHTVAARSARHGHVLDVVCLDQLYFQAVVIAPMLELKVLTWARKYGAFLQSVPCTDASSHDGTDTLTEHRSEVRLVRQGEGEENGGGRPTIDWSHSIKCSEDSVAKISERFNGAPQYLVDLVRQRIIFESVLELKDALSHICQDPDVVVVSLENGMMIPDSAPHTTQHPDLHQGGAFTKPAVTMYLILTTPLAHDMHVAGFVLEVELWLRDIWDLFESSLGDYRAYRQALLSEQSIFSATLRRGLRRMPVWASRVSPSESDAHDIERGATHTLYTHPAPPDDDIAQPAAHAVDRSLVPAARTHTYTHTHTHTNKTPSGNYSLKNEDIQEYFAVRPQNLQGCAGNGMCSAIQGIPPILVLRVGVQIYYADSKTQTLVCPARISCDQGHSRLQEVLRLLNSPCGTHKNTGVEVGAHFQSDENQHVDGLAQRTGTEVLPSSRNESTSIRDSESWYGRYIENKCVMTPELAKILRGKCSERGDSMEFCLIEGILPTRSAHWASLLFSSRPITLALHTRKYQIAVFLCGCYMIYFGTTVWLFLQTQNRFTSSHVRFSATRLRGAAASSELSLLPPTIPGVASIGLMLDGCALELQSEMPPPHMLVENSSMYLSYRSPVTANGFSVRTLAGNNTEMLDAVVFK